MQEYIKNIKRLNSDDFVNSENVNAIVKQLQHNVDLLYNQQSSSNFSQNISDLVFGNILDYDSTGQKRLVNGGKFDSIEKIIPFEPNIGTIGYDNYASLEQEHWLSWRIDSGVTNNVRLIRNIHIPEAIKHQTILLAIKGIGFEGTTPIEGEDFDIYVNGEHAGSGKTGTHYINGNLEPRTIYAVYNLTGQESNLEISISRSPLQTSVPDNYVFRMSNMYAGLHTLGNDFFTMNFPISGSHFVEKASDINSFYNFENNSIRPIPSFLIDGELLTGNNASTINITTESNSLTQYFVGDVGTGDQTGQSSSNRMSSTDFFNKTTFEMNPIVANFSSSTSYDNFTFDKGNYVITFDGDVNVTNVTVDDNSSVSLTPYSTQSIIDIDTFECRGKSRFEMSGGSVETKMIMNDIMFEESSYVNMTCGTFGMSITGSGQVKGEDNSIFNLTLTNSTLDDNDGLNGFGLSMTPIELKDRSTFTIKNNNTNNLEAHIGNSTSQDGSILIDNYSKVSIDSNFDLISTSSTDKKIEADSYSNVEISSLIQSGSGSTAFETVELNLFSSFCSTLSAGSFGEIVDTYSVIRQI